jgi:hypothetical protein
MSEPEEVGPITSSIYQLRRLVAESAAFQTRVEAADATAALAKIKTWDYEDDPVALQRARPFACVWPADRFDLVQISGGGQSLFSGQVELVLILTDIDRGSGDREVSGANFAGWLDLVLQDVAAAAGVDDRVPIKHVTFLQRPLRTATKDEPSSGAFWQAAFLVTCG